MQTARHTVSNYSSRCRGIDVKSLEQWTRELSEIMQRPEQADGSRSVVVPKLNGLTMEQLEEIGLTWDEKSTHVTARCRRCDNHYEVDGDLATEDWDQGISYCGGSQFCTP